MKNIESISYKYNTDFKKPITYYIKTKNITTSLSYEDALEIASAFIDSLGGDYDYLEDLIEEYETEKNKSIRMEAI